MTQEPLFAALIERIRNGDEEAAAEVVRRFEPQVRLEVRARLRLQDSRLRRVFDSTDICQSVLASFFTRASAGQYSLDDAGSLRNLLTRMAQIKLLEEVRRQQRGRRDIRRVTAGDSDAAPLPGTGPEPGDLVASREMAQRVRDRLSDEERQLADLRGAGHEWGEIAQTLGGTPEGRRKQFARAVGRLSRELGD